MAVTAKKLYRAQPGTTDTLLYTVPASTTTIVKEVSITNTTAAPATITLGLSSGATLAAANHFLSAVSIAANSTVTYPLSQVLAAAETIRALQGTASALTVHISGVELT